VHIELSVAEYHLLNVALGAAASTSFGLRQDFIRLVNRINEGHPKWTPFPVNEENQ
jgi:hypothetical protein